MSPMPRTAATTATTATTGQAGLSGLPPFSRKSHKVFVIALAVACGLLGFMLIDHDPSGQRSSPAAMASARPLPPAEQANHDEAKAAAADIGAAPRANEELPPAADQSRPWTGNRRAWLEGPEPPAPKPAPPASTADSLKKSSGRQAQMAGDRIAASAFFALLHPSEGDELTAEARESRLNALLHRLPASAPLHAALGTLLAQRGDWPEAAQAFRSAVDNDRLNPRYRQALATSLEHLRLPDEARKHYRKALELTDGNALNEEASEIEKGLRLIASTDARP